MKTLILCYFCYKKLLAANNFNMNGWQKRQLSDNMAVVDCKTCAASWTIPFPATIFLFNEDEEDE